MQAYAVNWVDYTILSLIGVSVLMGVLRGFVRESFSMVTWIAAIFLGIVFCEPVSTWFGLDKISMVILRYAISFLIVALTVLIIGGILSHLIFRLIKFTGFSVTDRIIGFIFGLGRGVVAVALIIMFFLPTPFSKDPVWQQSALIPRFTPTSLWLKGQMPQLINWVKGRVPDWAKELVPEDFFKGLQL